MATSTPSWVTPYTFCGGTFTNTSVQLCAQRRVLPGVKYSGTRRVAARAMASGGGKEDGGDEDTRGDNRSAVTSDASPAPWDGSGVDAEKILGALKFNDAGLVAAVAQQHDTGEVLMLAWMNAEAVRETMQQGRAVYFSRSRSQLWRKGDTSGQVQLVHDVVVDCDGDAVLLRVDQKGVACHTGRRSCFYRAFRPPTGDERFIADVLTDPKEMYGGGGDK